MAHDTERQRTYYAETQAFDETAYEARIGVRNLEILAAKIRLTSIFRRSDATGLRILEARSDARRSSASYPDGDIRIAYGQDTVATLIHEIAHLIAPHGHHAEFRGAQVELARIVAGRASATRLRETYLAHGLAADDFDELDHVDEAGLAAALIDLPAENKHVRRICGLLAKAESTTADEAEALQAKALELSARYGISRAVLDAARLDAEGGLVERELRLGAGPYVAARFDILHAITTARCCEVVWQNDRQGRVVFLLGHREDVRDVQELFNMLDHQARMSMLTANPAGNTMAFRRAWLFGFASEIAEKMQAAERQAVAEADAKADRGQASVALVIAERKTRVREFRDQRHGRVRAVGHRKARSDAGLAGGRAAGRAARLPGRDLPSTPRALGPGS